MSFTLTITDTASINVVLGVNANPNYADLYDVSISTVYLDDLMATGTVFRLDITHPSDSNVTALVSTVSLPLSGNPIIATVKSTLSAQTTLQWEFNLQFQTGPTTWANVTQDTNSTYTINLSGTDYTAEIYFDSSATTSSVTRKLVGSPTNVTIGSVTYVSTVDGAIPYDYRIILPEQTSVDNVNVDDLVTPTIPATSTVNLIGILVNTNMLRGTDNNLQTGTNWSRANIKTYDAGAGTVNVNDTNFTYNGVTYTTLITSSQVLIHTEVSLTATTSSFTDFTIGVV